MNACICFIVQQTNFGGSEVHTLALIDALIERGYNIELISNRYDGYDQPIRRHPSADRVRIIHTDIDGIMYGERTNREGWRQALRDLKSNVGVLVKGNNNYGQLGFLRECRSAFGRLVFIEHLEARERPRSSWLSLGSPPKLGLWWYKRMILSRLGARQADAIAAVSGKVKERLVRDFGYRDDQVTVIRNGVPWQRFGRSRDRGVHARRQHGIAPDAFVFGMLTRLSREKAVDVALHGLRSLVDRHPERAFCMVIAGEGYAAEELHALVRTLGLGNYVKFVGFVANPEEILSAYDVILFSSRVEGLPLGLLQGMAAGCLPIVTRISGMPEAVNSEEVGWVVEPENPVELGAALHAALMLDDVAVARMRERIVTRIREHFDIVESNRRLVALLEARNGEPFAISE